MEGLVPSGAGLLGGGELAGSHLRLASIPISGASCLIAMALKNSKTGSLPVSEIYSFMKEHFPYFKVRALSQGGVLEPPCLSLTSSAPLPSLDLSFSVLSRLTGKSGANTPAQMQFTGNRTGLGWRSGTPRASPGGKRGGAGLAIQHRARQQDAEPTLGNSLRSLVNSGLEKIFCQQLERG